MKSDLSQAIDRQRQQNPKKIEPVAWILKLVFSRLGPAITGLISMALGVIVTQTARLGIEMDAEVQMQLVGVISFLVWGAIMQAINRYTGKYADLIQEALGVTRDRWIGPSTAAEIAAAAAVAKRAEPVQDITLSNLTPEQIAQIQAVLEGGMSPHPTPKPPSP